MSVTMTMDQVQAFAATGLGTLKDFAIGMFITVPFLVWLNMRTRKSDPIWTNDRESMEPGVRRHRGERLR
jgi:hypothetical protein